MTTRVIADKEIEVRGEHEQTLGRLIPIRNRSLIAFALAIAFFAFVCDTVQAEVLVSNLDESATATATVGKSTANPNAKYTQAIGFRTGSNDLGYNLTSIRVALEEASESDGVRVRIFNSRSNGNPFYSLYTLSNPNVTEGTNTFSTPTSTTLESDTWYFIVFDSTASEVGNDYKIRGTESDVLNSSAAGWSLKTDRQFQTRNSLFWSTGSAVPLIEINGDEVVQATDATLSSLSVKGEQDGYRTSFSPFFDPSMTSYTVNAPTQVEQVTVEAIANIEEGASVDYRNAEDQELSDADLGTEELQINLVAGENTVNVKVTAEDGSTTRTYTVVVTRQASRVASDALISNFDEHISKRLYVGNLEPDKRLRTHAVGFETGANETGYVVSSIRIIIWEITHSAGVRVRIFTSTDEDTPNSSLYTMSGTAVLPTDDGVPSNETTVVSTFDAPASAILESNTRYFVVLDSRSSIDERFYKVFGTKSDAISYVADGWSLNNFRHTGIRDTGVWTVADEVPFVEVTGHAFVPSSNASLSGLALTWDDDGTETDVVLNPIFDVATTAYTASVVNDVDRITMDATKGDSGAELIYVDGSDTQLTDADTHATGFQIDLDVGSNTIKAKVTAEDDDTTQTYTVVVTRLADVTAPSAPRATVDGDTLVIAFNEALAAAANLVNGAFAVKKTPSGGSETTVGLSGSPSISGARVTLTLANEVLSSDTAIKVSYTKPTTGTANTLRDAHGNEVANFTDLAVTNETGGAPPDAPAIPTLTAGTTWLDVSWTAPVDNGAAISDYDVRYRESGGNWQVVDHTGTGTTRRIGNLTADTAYEVQVRATNAEGSSDWSVAAAGRTNALPALTASFENVPTTHDGTSVFTLTLAFTEAVFDGTEAIDKNQAIRDALQVTGGSVTGGRRVNRTAFDRWFLWFRPSGSDDVTVRLPATTGSCNAAGAICTLDDRPLSLPVTATIVGPSADVPDVPTAPTLTVGATWVEASWTAPADNGSAITGYDVHYRAGGNWLDAGYTGTGTTQRVENLSPDTVYEVRVRAVNAEGTGDWSPTSSRRTDADVPDTPTAPTLTAGSTWLEASWTAPADNGSVITGYDVHYRVSGNWLDAGHTSTGTTRRIDSLTADTNYEVRVRATNAEGTGDWSVSSSGRTNADVPDAPTAPTLTAGTTWLEATWSAPTDNGSVIIGYDVHYRVSGNWLDAGHTGSGTTQRIDSLTADTAYEVRVRATNAQGTGDWSPTVYVRTNPAEEVAEGDVRLVNGSTDQEGRVEIYHNSEWGTVCDDRFVDDDAEVVCRQLGYTGGQAHIRAAFGAGSGTIWMDDVSCTGNESRLADCWFSGWGLHNCRHSEDVGVSCGASSNMVLNDTTLHGATLTLDYDRPLDTGSVPSPRDFVVTSNALTMPTAISIESVTVTNGDALLSLSRAVAPSEHVSVSYLPGAMHPLQDSSRNPAPPVTVLAIMHSAREIGYEVSTKTIDSLSQVRETEPSDLRKVDVLDLSTSDISDLAPLAALEDVEQLDLSENNIEEIWPLVAMSGLEELNLRDNTLVDVSALASLPQLRVLDLSSNVVSDVTPLIRLQHLRRLDLSNNQLTNIQPLSELKALEVLLLDGNRISNIASLSSLQELRHLSLRNNRIPDTGTLRGAHSLRRLDFAGNRLRDVWTFGDLPNIEWLRLSGNPIVDFAPLRRVPTLRWLVLDIGTSREVGFGRDVDQLPRIVIETGERKQSGKQHVAPRD